MSMDERNLIRILSICFRTLLEHLSREKFVVACEFYDQVFSKYYLEFEIYRMKVADRLAIEKNKILAPNLDTIKKLESE